MNVLLLIVLVNTVFGVERGGLRTSDGDEFPLRNVEVKVDVMNTMAKLEIRQTYVNVFEKVMNVEYYFLLDDAYVISEITVFLDNKMIKTVAAAKESTARSERNYEGLNTEKLGDYIIFMLGNMDVGKKVEVVITYLTELRLEGQDYIFVLPSVLAPSYGILEKRHADVLNKYADDVEYSLNIEVNLDVSPTIEFVFSPSHQSTEINLKKGKVSLSGMVHDRDFVVYIKTEEDPDTPHIWLEHDSDSTMSMVSFNTDSLNIKKSLSPKEIMFIIDTSESMMGENIISAKQTLIDLLKLLENSNEELITFNIIEFSSSFSALFKSSQRPNPEMIQRAIHFVDRLKSSGRKDFFAALEEVYTLYENSKKETILIVITDGEIVRSTVLDEIYYLITEKSKIMPIKVFSIGIGRVSPLVNGIARVGNGISEFVLPGKKYEDLLTRTIERIHDEIITITSIEWGSEDLDFVAPSGNTSLYKNMIISKYAHFKTKGTNTEKVKIHFSNGQSLTITNIEHKNGNVMHKLGAWRRIQELSNMAECFEGDPLVVDEIISLSIKYNILSRIPSMITVGDAGKAKDEKYYSLPLFNYCPELILWEGVPLYDMTLLSYGIGIDKKFTSVIPIDHMNSFGVVRHRDLVISVPKSGYLEVEILVCGGEIENITDKKCENIDTKIISFPTNLSGQDIIVQITAEIDKFHIVTITIEHNSTILLSKQFPNNQITNDAILDMQVECDIKK